MRKTISTATTTVTSPAWTFAPDSVTVNGYTSTARYSLAKDATLYVFAGMLTPGTDKLTPVRFALKPAQGEIYTAALSAAGLTPAPEEPAATVEDVGPAEPAAPVEDVEPAEPAAPVENVKPKRAPRKKAAPAVKADPVQAEEAAPAPVEDVGSDEPVKPAPVEKPWIGTSISGDGWKIDFDAKVERTCIRFAATPTACSPPLSAVSTSSTNRSISNPAPPLPAKLPHRRVCRIKGSFSAASANVKAISAGSSAISKAMSRS